jgi:hypothetical protein
MATDGNPGGGRGWIVTAAVVGVLGAAFLYQRDGGKIFGPGGVAEATAPWVPGKPHPAKPNVVAGRVPNDWQPAPGYAWADPGNADLRVKWVPGSLDPGRPNIVAAEVANKWRPADGYQWLTWPLVEGDLRVVPLPELKGITSGWDAGTFTHDVTFTNGSGADLTDVAVTVTLYRDDGERVPVTKFWARWAKGEVVKVNVRAHPYQKRTMTGSAFRGDEKLRVDLLWTSDWK